MIRFEKDNDGVKVSVTIQDEGTWMEVTDHFVDFLFGCGYILDHQELADYLNEEYKNIMMFRRNADEDKD